MTQRNLSMKQEQIHGHREQTMVAKRGKDWGRDRVGSWGSVQFSCSVVSDSLRPHES